MTSREFTVRVSIAATVLLGAAVRMSASDDAISPPGRLRDPFSPIGYRPMASRPREPMPSPSATTSPARFVPSPEMWDEARRMVQVQGFSSIGGRKMAVVNDRVVGIGDPVEIVYRGFLFRWVVDTLDEQGINLRRREETNDAVPETERPPPRREVER